MKPEFSHMSPAESVLWKSWLEEFGTVFSSFVYDLHVGEGITIGPEYDVMTQGLAKSLTQKRIDVVAMQGTVVWIIEVKVQAGLSALGQLMGYKTLYEREHPELGSVRLVLVTDNILPDDLHVMEVHGIRVDVVKPSIV